MSIVNFEEHMSDRSSNVIFDSLNRLYDAKKSGVLGEDELSKIIILEGKLFSNQVSKGIKNEEDIESFETLLPNNNYFNANHKNLDVARDTIKQANTVALYNRENRFSRVKSI